MLSKLMRIAPSATLGAPEQAGSDANRRNPFASKR
jgi:hypothetical protein